MKITSGFKTLNLFWDFYQAFIRHQLKPNCAQASLQIVFNMLLMLQLVRSQVFYWLSLLYITTRSRAKRTDLGARVKVGVSLAPSWCPGTKKVVAKFRTWPWSRWEAKNRNLEDSTICTPLGGLFEKSLLNRSCLYYRWWHPEGVQLHPDQHGGRRQADLGYLDHLEAPERHFQWTFTK